MKIAVFCSANKHIDPDFFSLTEEFGKHVWLLLFLKRGKEGTKRNHVEESRVSGGSFTLPSLGTVLDSLPSHGSSHLTLLFISLYSLLT